ncbi:PLP-dependent aminotransferase family protein [Leucothrix sargassi]|nr:PLP-dependent aminotransferase family protein [Leucothrix sargassi]
MTPADFPSELFIPFNESDDNTPQYLRVFKALKQAIAEGKLIAGAKLPASRTLSSSLNVSRNTVKAAYEMLLAEGYIITKHGSGSFVSSELPEYLFESQQTPTDESQQAQNQLSTFAKRLAQDTAQQAKQTSLALRPLQVCLDSFPWANWQSHVTKAARQMKFSTRESHLGHALLRTQISDYLSVVRGVRCDEEQVIICSGGQQAIYITLQLLVNAGDEVLLEDPGYSGIANTVTALGAKQVHVNVDEQGFSVNDALNKAPKARVAIVTPSRNHPLGYTLSLQRRMALIHWAQQNGSWIIEDDYDSEFRFDGKPIGALQGLDQQGRVIYAGTFTRILHPSIRIGYVVVPKPLIGVFSQTKKIMDGGLVTLPQVALANFMASGQFASHLRRMRKLYQQRRDTLHQLIEQALPQQLERIESDGGMHSVFLLPAGYYDVTLCKTAHTRGLGIQALSTYYKHADKQQGLILGFAGNDEASMTQAVKTLAEIINEYAPTKDSHK